MNDIKYLINKFLNNLKDSKADLYNEFSFQFELGIFLKEHLTSYKIQFERNISYFLTDYKEKNLNWIKREIDISIFDYNKKEKYAIELKYPLNGQYPEQMYSFIKDIKFLEELKSINFNTVYSVVLVKDPLFYKGNADKENQIYQFFRNRDTNKTLIKGSIYKPTGKRKGEEIKLKGEYCIEWQNCIINGEHHKYYIIAI